ncbi:MAG: hypothetical protein ABTB30_07175, partial [Clostridia bacterium]
MINLLWGAQRLFQAAIAVPVGIAAMVIGQLGNEWMKAAKKESGAEEKKPAAAVKAPATEKPAAP